jgi:hypothetical protein
VLVIQIFTRLSFEARRGCYSLLGEYVKPKMVWGLNAPPPAVLDGRRGGANEDWFVVTACLGGKIMRRRRVDKKGGGNGGQKSVILMKPPPSWYVAAQVTPQPIRMCEKCPNACCCGGYVAAGEFGAPGGCVVAGGFWQSLVFLETLFSFYPAYVGGE